MVRLTWKGMRARKWRLLMSMLSVLLGVAFVTASLTLGETVRGSFDGPIVDANAGVDVFVQPAAEGTFSTHGVPDEALTLIREVDGVAQAEGIAGGFTQVRSSGADAATVGVNLGIGWMEDEELNPLTLRAGVAPKAPGEVVLDSGTAEKLGVDVGDVVRLVTLGPAPDVRVVGVAEVGDGGVSAVGVAAATAREVYGMSDRWDEVAVRGEDGLSQAALADRIAKALGQAGFAQQVEVRTEASVTEENLEQIAEETGMITTFLAVFAGITLFVGGFLIVNTFSMLVAQRLRELAVLRSLGASRAQLVGGVVMEASTVGLVASVFGLGLGVLVSMGLLEVLRGAGLTIPDSGVGITAMTAAVALVLGPVVTAVAALLPARRAARVAPVEAMREAALPSAGGAARSLIAALLAVVAAVGLVMGAEEGAVAPVALGGVAAVLAAIAGGPLLVRQWARLLGRPLARLGGGTARLAVGNLGRSPKRAAATASALVVGLALVQGTAVVGASMSGMAEQAIEETITGDVVVWGGGGMPFAAEIEGEVAQRDDVELVVPVQFGEVEVTVPGGVAETTTVYATAPEELAQVVELEMVTGSLEELSDTSLVVVDGGGLVVGDSVELSVPGAEPARLTVTGTYAGTPALGGHLVTPATLGTLVPDAHLVAMYLKVADGAVVDEVAAAIDTWLLDAHPLVSAHTMDEFIEANRSVMDQAVTVITALLGLSLVIALLGVSNTLSLSALERTRELGILRAIGMSRFQTRWTIRWESLLIGLYGVVLGSVLGLALGAAVSGVLMENVEVPVVVPTLRIVVVGVVAVAAAVLAAGLPARRAARMDVLAAVSTA